MEENIKSAQEVHHKQEFYFVALAFTILGFSIQTASLKSSCLLGVVELVSWCFLFISGVIGFYRIERFPIVYRCSDFLIKKKGEIDPSVKKKCIKAEETIKKIKTNNGSLYIVQKAFFLLSILLLIIVRSVVLF